MIPSFQRTVESEELDRILGAVIDAAGTRLRPILMTSAATVFGHLPLVFARGPGAGARNSIGITLVSGMIIGTFFTLFVVPAIYTLVARVRVPVVAREAEAAGAGEEAVRGRDVVGLAPEAV